MTRMRMITVMNLILIKVKCDDIYIDENNVFEANHMISFWFFKLKGILHIKKFCGLILIF